jgi:alpha-ketoglutarate-dependent 2,4-dichlorophenoxyacetate dioxygenase
MSSEESLKRIDELISFATQKEFIYTHNWSDGDVVMWDNRATMHRGRPWGINEPRHMVRTTISATPIDGLDSMWPPKSSH